jgi:poly-gamma-glutamate system protein
MLAAARIMAEASSAIRDCRSARKTEENREDDANRTGLIGLRYSSITTTLGDLGAKRTTTNPNLAALLVKLLADAGAKRGEAIAIGASGSFPALVLATLSAAKAMGLRPILISSLGASQWGANDPAFTYLEMEDCVVEKGILSYRAAAVSLGGDQDRASELAPEAAAFLRTRAEASGARVIDTADLAENVRERMELYRQGASGERLAAFVNIGGTWANLGTDPAVLALRPGLDRISSVPEPSRRGVLFEMARKGIPVIHLLNIKDLVVRYGLPWDPVPLPAVGEGDLYQQGWHAAAWRLSIAGGYLAFVVAVALVWRRFPWERRREQF